MISYCVNEVSEDDDEKVIFEVSNSQGELVRKFSRKAEKGFNRFTWRLERDGQRRPGSPKPKDDDAAVHVAQPSAHGASSVREREHGASVTAG